MSDLKTVTFDASHRALIKRAAEIIQAGADGLKEAHCLNGDWRDSDLARRDYYDELAVVGQLCAMLARSQSADHSGEATEKVDHVAEVRNMVAAQSAGQEAVGVAGTMPGTDGFTMACFKADAVPVGTQLYAAPVNGGERELAQAIHYPECWDTAAYPTLTAALTEVYASFRCTNDECRERAADAPQVGGDEWLAEADRLIMKLCDTTHAWARGPKYYEQELANRTVANAACDALKAHLRTALTSPAKEQK